MVDAAQPERPAHANPGFAGQIERHLRHEPRRVIQGLARDLEPGAHRPPIGPARACGPCERRALDGVELPGQARVGGGEQRANRPGEDDPRDQHPLVEEMLRRRCLDLPLQCDSGGDRGVIAFEEDVTRLGPPARSLQPLTTVEPESHRLEHPSRREASLDRACEPPLEAIVLIDPRVRSELQPGFAGPQPLGHDRLVQEVAAGGPCGWGGR